MMGDLSPHFSRSEFKCHHCGAGCASPQLLDILERLRTVSGGRPMTIVSGFRCVVHNQAISGADDSRHTYGDAADLRDGVYSVQHAVMSGAVGIGTKNGWVTHVDWRPGGPARWQY